MSGRGGVFGLPPEERRRLIEAVERVHALGPRPLAELLLELAEHDVAALQRVLDRYAAAAPAIQALAANDWTAPIRAALAARRAA